ncbi:MAG: class I SAM-dependent methyltransferase, partial [Oceanipulchritudo sp.]
MEAEVYERMARMETRHWWFRGRRRILRHLLRHFTPPGRSVRILEAGCGTGGNLEMLAAFGEMRTLTRFRSACRRLS